MTETTALAKYLGRTQEARGALAKEDRLSQLLDGLAEMPLFDRGPREDHLMGDKLDLDFAIHRVLAQRDDRYFEGRPVRGERHPSNEELVPLIRAQLPRWLSPRVNDAQIENQLDRFRLVRPWPFDVLAT